MLLKLLSEKLRPYTSAIPEHASVIAALKIGRLGNQMSAFALVYSLGSKHGLRPLMWSETRKHFNEVFEDSSDIPTVEKFFCYDLCSLDWKPFQSWISTTKNSKGDLVNLKNWTLRWFKASVPYLDELQHFSGPRIGSCDELDKSSTKYPPKEIIRFSSEFTSAERIISITSKSTATVASSAANISKKRCATFAKNSRKSHSLS